MSNLVACSCGAKISAGANRCPKCGVERVPPGTRMFLCRACKTPLRADMHVIERGSSYIHEGNTQFTEWVEQRPCTNCGEPNPAIIRKSKAIWWLIAIVIAVIWIWNS